ncbi:MAG: stage II sporulation protein M [Chthoniobacteraceae bacterium]
MIIDLPRFIAAERPAWTELEAILDDLALNPGRRLTLEEARRFHFLYQKTSADLGRVATFASEPELLRYLESLVARAYADIHETRERGVRWHPLRWLLIEFPTVFRRQVGAFWMSMLVTLLGTAFGAFALLLDDEAKAAIVPAQFAHVLKDPAQRVAEEEAEAVNPTSGAHATFAAQLMANNIGVSIKTLALGMTWGIGTVLMLFYNGVILGLVGADFIAAGQTAFLVGWLLPHGSFEIPAIIIAGQAGFVLARALIGRGDRSPLAARLRAVARDVATLVGGVAVLLVWAGIVESYFSQHHQPRIPYSLKIAFGIAETVLLAAFLSSAWWRKMGATR